MPRSVLSIALFAALGAASASGTVFTVGPGGTHSTIPAAMDTAKVLGALAITGGVDDAVIASRAFADPGTGAGTYGQYYPTLTAAKMLAPGERTVLPLPRNDTRFSTNVGMLNTAAASCSGRIRVLSAAGTQVGSSQTLTARADEWAQVNEIFAKARAGTHTVAAAQVKVLTANCRGWFAASVSDHAN